MEQRRRTPSTARLHAVRSKPDSPDSAVNWPALLVLWAIALTFVLLSR
jgi:hypothetical protein